MKSISVTVIKFADNVRVHGLRTQRLTEFLGYTIEYSRLRGIQNCQKRNKSKRKFKFSPTCQIETSITLTDCNRLKQRKFD